MSDSMCIMPPSAGTDRPRPKAKAQADKFIPQKGGILLEDPLKEGPRYNFYDSSLHLAQQKYEENEKRRSELEEKDETRGFMKQIEELGQKNKWDEALQVLERRTTVTSGLFLVVRAVLRWRFRKFGAALEDADTALRQYASSKVAGPLAAGFAAMCRLCLGSQAQFDASNDAQFAKLVGAWEQVEKQALHRHSVDMDMFKPRKTERVDGQHEVIPNMVAQDGTYVAETGVKIGYVFLQNKTDDSAPVVLHFHGNEELASDYKLPRLAEKYRDIPVHLLVVDFRGYGWSAGEPSLSTYLRDAEPLAAKLPEIFIEFGLPWPYPGGLILSGRSLGSQVAIHLAAMFPKLFRALVLDSAIASSAVGDRLGRGTERLNALEYWRDKLKKASLEVLQPLDCDLESRGALEKIRGFDGLLLLMHGLADEIVPFEAAESLHAAAGSKEDKKELKLIEDARHNNIGKYDEYWTSFRRFSLKVQLDDTLPSAGAVQQHLCVVCGEKAASKCGRCQKMWYCSRKHQAEHWSVHRKTCAGGAPTPAKKENLPKEAEVCLIAMVTAELATTDEFDSLSRCLESVGAQTERLHAVYVGWHAETSNLRERVIELLKGFERKHRPLEVVAIEAPSESSRFEHLRALARVAENEAPAHAWLLMADGASGELWSSRRAATLLPALRKAAANSKVIGASCPVFARMASGSSKSEVHQIEEVEDSDHEENRETKSSLPLALVDAVSIDAALAAGTVEVCTEQTRQESLLLANISVRAKMLTSFINSTPAPVLSHEFCDVRFQYYLSHIFGKKLETLTVPEGEWLHWVPSGRQGQQELVPPEMVIEEDWRRGHELYDYTSRNQIFASASEAALAVAKLRRQADQMAIRWCGEVITPKELKTAAAELAAQWLEDWGLESVLGLQKWAKDLTIELSEVACLEFAVKKE